MCHPRLLLLLLLLCAQTSRALRLYDATSILSCLHAALAEARHELPAGTAELGRRGTEEASEEWEGDGEPDEELGKRTFPGQGHPRATSRARAKGKASGATSERRAKVTLSLDVPTNLMNILFNIAKAKNLRAKAAANAHLMAQIGRRK